MADSVIAIGDQLTAAKLNQLFGMNSAAFTYNTDGTVNTITDSTTGVVYTFAYNTDGSVNTVSDASNTWTMAYNSNGDITSITRS